MSLKDEVETVCSFSPVTGTHKPVTAPMPVLTSVTMDKGFDDIAKDYYGDSSLGGALAHYNQAVGGVLWQGTKVDLPEKEILMTSAPRPPQQKDFVTYTVKKGDTLWDIAISRLGTPNAIGSILALNPQIQDPSRIYEGEKFLLPLRPTSSLNPIINQESLAKTQTTFSLAIYGGSKYPPLVPTELVLESGTCNIEVSAIKELCGSIKNSIQLKGEFSYISITNMKPLISLESNSVKLKPSIVNQINKELQYALSSSIKYSLDDRVPKLSYSSEFETIFGSSSYELKGPGIFSLKVTKKLEKFKIGSLEFTGEFSFISEAKIDYLCQKNKAIPITITSFQVNDLPSKIVRIVVALGAITLIISDPVLLIIASLILKQQATN